LNSALLECRLLHHRVRPREHRFANRIFFLALDLSELDAVSQGLVLFSRNRRNLYSFQDADFLTGTARAASSGGPLLETVRSHLAAQQIEAGQALRVVLVAIPRIVGYLFNPVCFYFCYEGQRPLGAVAEVTNTFREVKTFWVPPTEDGSHFEARLPKEFYVSPFTECDGEFVFSLRYGEGQLSARIDEYEGGKLVVHTVLVGEKRVLTDRQLAWYAVKYPLLGMQVMARIHTQALRLYLKRVPWWRKNDQGNLQKNFYRPGVAESPASSGAIDR
jgi:uncharacterized protein